MLADKTDIGGTVLIRRLRPIPDPRAVGGILSNELLPAEPERVRAAPAGMSPFTDVIRIWTGHTWSYFVAEVVGAPGSNPYMSTAEAASLLGVDERTIRRWARDGRLDAKQTAGGQKRRGSWLVTVESVRSAMPRPSELEPGPGPKESKPKPKRKKSSGLKLWPGQSEFPFA